MAWEYLSVGTQRFTAQAYLGRTDNNLSTRMYHVFAVGSTPNAQVAVALRSGGGAQLTTATAGTTYLSLPLTTSGTAMTSYWDSHYGTLLEGPVLLQTCVGFSYAVVQYVQVPR